MREKRLDLTDLALFEVWASNRSPRKKLGSWRDFYDPSQFSRFPSFMERYAVSDELGHALLRKLAELPPE